jgi:chromosome segregation ATPase
MRTHERHEASRYGIDELRTSAIGCERGAVRTMLESIGARLDAADLELAELRRSIADADEELAARDDEDALEEAIELSHQVAAAVTAEARDQAETEAAEAEREAAELEQRESVALEELTDEVERAASRIAARRRRLEEALHAALAGLEEVPLDAGEPLDGVVDVLRRPDQPS